MFAANRHALFALSLSLVGATARADESLSADHPSFDLVAELQRGTALGASEAAARALVHAPALERADALAHAADAAIASARVQLLPTLAVNARYAHVDGFPDGRIGPTSSPEQQAAARGLADQVEDPAARALWLGTLERQGQAQTIKIPRDQVSFTARISYPVSDLFFAVLPSIDAARSLARARHAEASARTARIRLSALEAYFQLARARGSLAVAQRASEQARAQQARLDAGVRAGIRTPADASSAAARVASADQAVVAAEAGVDLADAALRTLLQDDGEEPYGLSEPLLGLEPEAEPLPTPQLLERARAQRAEISALNALLEGQRKLAKVIDAGGYPHLSVFAGAEYGRPNRFVIPPSSRFQDSWEAGVQLAYTPNESLLAARRQRENRAQVAALTAQLRELSQALVLEVRNARAVLVRANRSTSAAESAQSAAEDAYHRRVAELQVGEVTTADLFSAENDLNQARLQVLDAAIERRLARARLAYAVGD